METVHFDPMIPSFVNNWRLCSSSPVSANKELHFNDTDESSGFALESPALGCGERYPKRRRTVRPQGQATRAQVAQMLKNFIENEEGDTIQ